MLIFNPLTPLKSLKTLSQPLQTHSEGFYTPNYPPPLFLTAFYQLLTSNAQTFLTTLKPYEPPLKTSVVYGSPYLKSTIKLVYWFLLQLDT